MHDTFRSFAFDQFDVGRLQTLCHQPSRTVDIWVRHGAAGIRFEGNVCAQPAFAKTIQHAGEISLVSACEGMKKTVLAFEHGAWPDESRLCETRSAVARLRRPAGMHAFCPCAFGQIFDDARRHAGCDAYRIGQLFCVKSQCCADPCGGADGTKYGGRMKARFVHQLWRDHTHAANDFAADRNADADIRTAQLMSLGGGENGRHDHRARVCRAAFECVIEIIAMCSSAVAECRHAQTAPFGLADHGAATRLIGRNKGGLHKIRLACRNANTRDVNQQRLANGHSRVRCHARQACDHGGELLGYAERGCCQFHSVCSLV